MGDGRTNRRVTNRGMNKRVFIHLILDSIDIDVDIDIDIMHKYRLK